MKVTHRIRSIGHHLAFVPTNGRFVLGLPATPARAGEIGFSIPLVEGEHLLPSGQYGTACHINAEGWTEVHRDREKETVYYPIVWRWNVKRGHHLEPHSRIVNRSVKRFPRTLHAPLGLELAVTPSSSGEVFLTLPAMQKGVTPDLTVVTAINMLVELFGECEVFNDGLERFIAAPITRLNWDILPKGNLPWQQMRQQLHNVISQKRGLTREVFSHRFEVINSYQPEFCAIGKNGFKGYVIFGFPRRGFFLLESIHLGNATYGLGQDWAALSQLSKGELLNNGLHEFRIVHSASWEREVRDLFGRRHAA